MCVCCAVVRREIINNNCHFWHPPFGAIFALKGRFCCQPWPFLWWESMRSFEKLRLIISLRLVSVICSGRHCFHHCLTETGWGSQPSTRDVVENQKKSLPLQWGGFSSTELVSPDPGAPACAARSQVAVQMRKCWFLRMLYIWDIWQSRYRWQFAVTHLPQNLRCLKKDPSFFRVEAAVSSTRGRVDQQKENGINLGVGKCYIFTPLH